MFGALAVAALIAGSDGDKNFTPVKPQVFEEEKKAVPDLWVLDFEYRRPRFLMVNVPGEGKKIAWYMTYKLVNRTKEPHAFVPRFELVTNPSANAPNIGGVAAVIGEGAPGIKGLESKLFADTVLPQALRTVNRIEGKDFLDAVSVSKDPLAPTPPEGAAIVKHGVVFWKDVPMGDTKRFNIYVAGLSNGYRRVEDPKDRNAEKVLRKTLELRFSKTGDDYDPHSKEIRLEGQDWVYR